MRGVVGVLLGLQRLVALGDALGLGGALGQDGVGRLLVLEVLRVGGEASLGELAVARLLARASPETAVQQLLQLCYADPSRADPEMIKAEVALTARRRPATPAQASARARIFLAAARSTLRIAARRRPYAAMMACIDIPVLLIGGDAYRLVPVAAVRQAAARNPHWESVIFTGVGHTPQLEVPDAVTGQLADWLGRHF